MSQTPEQSICMSLVHEALHGAKQHGIDTTVLLQQAQIDESIHTRVSIEQYAQLWVLLADAMNDEFFGIDRRPLRRGSFQLLTKWLIHCKDLQQAIEETLHFFNLCFDDFYGQLCVDEHHAQIIIHDQSTIKSMFAYACYWMLIHSLICWLSGQRVSIYQLQLKTAQPIAHQDYQRRFCSNIQYNRQQNSLIFKTHYLSLPIKQDADSRHQFLQATPANLLVRFKNPAALSQRIRKALLKTPPQQWLDFRTLAQQLHMSEATLQRRLKAEGLSYQQLKNQIRCERALFLLQHTPLSMQHISEQLNFHDPSAFHRAFKKWTGKNPSYYRSLVSEHQ